jgi:DNA-binding MurR/RpiR family transcriptional regulator
MDNIVFFLQQILPTLTKTEQRIAEKIISAPETIPGMKISELGKETETTAPSITRFCKKIGLPGFPELKMEIAKEVYKAENKGLQMNLSLTEDIVDLQKAPELSDVIKNVISTATDSFSYLGNLVSPASIMETVKHIKNAGRCLIVGIGASGLVGLDLYQKLIRLGLNIIYNAEPHIQMVCANTLQKGDLAFVISYSGETPEIVSIAKSAKASGAFVIAVTRIGNTSLHRLADLSLLIPDTESICRNGAFISRLDQMLINDMIFYTLLSQFFDEYKEKINKTWQGVFSISSKIPPQQNGGAPNERERR